MGINIAVRVPPLASTIPPAVTPGGAGAVDDATDTARGDHDHPAGDVPSALALHNILNDRRIVFSAPITPAGPPAGNNGWAVDFSPDDDFIAVAHRDFTGTDGGGWMFPWDGTAFGARVRTAPNGTREGVSYRSDGAFVAFTGNGANLLEAFSWNGTVFGSQILAASPPANPEDVAFSPDGLFAAVAGINTPRLWIYPFDGVAFGTPITPATVPPGGGEAVAWHPDGTYVAIAHATTPFLTVYPFDGTTLGTPITPAAPPAGTGLGVDWSADGDFIAVAVNGNPALRVYPWTGSALGTPIDPAATAAIGRHVKFAPDQAFIALAHQGAPVLQIFPFTGNAIGAVLTPGTPPPGDCYGVDFSADGAFVVASHLAGTFVTVYAGERIYGF